MSEAPRLKRVLRRLAEGVVTRFRNDSRRWAQMLDGLDPEIFVALLDPRGLVLEANATALRLAGLPRERLIGQPVWEAPWTLDLPASRLQWRQLVQRAAAGDSVREDLQIRLPDGQVRTVDLHLRAEPDRRGRPRYLIPSARDVTEERQNRDALSEHLRRHRFHLGNTSMAVIEWDARLRIRDWSASAEAMFGWTRAEALDRSASELGLLAESERGNRQRWLRDLYSANEILSPVLCRCRRRDGSELLVETHRSLLRDGAGQIVSLLSFSQDVSAREQSLRDLRASEARYHGVFDQATVGVALLDAQGRWLQVNRSLCKIVGYDEAELLRLDFQSITHPEDLAKDVDLANRVLAGEIPGYQMEKRYLRRDGSLVWVLLHVGRIDATAELPVCFVSVIEDISARKAAERRLQALQISLEKQVGERTQQLRLSATASEQRNVELAQVAETTGLLAGARDVDEAMRIVGRSCRTLFPLADAALYLATEAPDRLQLREHWGNGPRPAENLLADHCWGLRRGHEHRVEEPGDPLRCRHHGGGEDGDDRAHSCLPLMALGERLGLLSLSWRAGAGWAPDPVLLRSLAEQIGLAIGNVRLREELRRQAQHDPLTGLLNRRQLDEHLRQRGGEYQRSGRGCSLLLLDLDYFKTINDRFGHEAGDRVLQEAAALFRRCARVEEAVFRLGGEEFVMVLATEDPGEAERAAERIRAEMQTLRVSRRGQILPAVTVSIGIACLPGDSPDVHKLVNLADEALYAAKHGGRNRAQRYDRLSRPPELPQARRS
ncbi:PAS domain S-box protein [Stagnimonas aquatica]|uniref:PAS domain S-box protein n=1 Tax=Stagnimonas aquatica TaxID=2689987 RepID=A0A3N0VDN3_9GAMM|nr:PAS domain S-box protein [Stagnimonas aquatica]ROH90792.1 PAS domain S-box protein [Stagnimonas aquatica]